MRRAWAPDAEAERSDETPWSRGLAVPKQVRCFTWATRRDARLDQLFRSAAKHRVEVEVIGLGMTHENLLFKISALLGAVERLHEHDLVVCTDGYDVLYLQGEAAIRAKFQAFGAPLVCSAERLFSHQIGAFRTFYDRSGMDMPYRYLNSGCIIGFAGAVRSMLRTVAGYDFAQVRRALGRGFFCDQTLIGKYAFERPESVLLDRTARLSWCTAGEWDQVKDLAVLRNGRLCNLTTGTDPAIVHVPCRSQYAHVLDYLERVAP